MLKLKKIAFLAASAFVLQACVFDTPADNVIPDSGMTASSLTQTRICKFSESHGTIEPRQRSIKLDVYNPSVEGGLDASKITSIVVFFHGGGWFSGSEKGIIPESAYDGTKAIRALYKRPVYDFEGNDTGDEQGALIISASYRLTNYGQDISTPEENRFPGQLIDAKAAINCAKILAGELEASGMQANLPIVASGASAGGVLAKLVGLTQNLEGTEPESPNATNEDELDGGAPDGGTSVKAVISLDGPVDISLLHADTDPLPTIMVDPDGDGMGESVDIRGEHIVDHLMCGSNGCVNGITDSTEKDNLLKSASPLYCGGADNCSDRQDNLITYIACGDTTFTDYGTGLDDCSDGVTYESGINHPDQQYHNVWVNETNVNHVVVGSQVYWKYFHEFFRYKVQD